MTHWSRAGTDQTTFMQDRYVEELRDSIMADFERLRESGVLSLPKQGPAANGAAPAANGNGVVRRQPGAVLP